MKSILTTLVTLLAMQSATAAVQIDGFGSLYMGQASGDILASGATNKQPQFAQYSLIGLNLYSKLENNLSVGAQLLAKGSSAASPGQKAAGAGAVTSGTAAGSSVSVVSEVPGERPFNLNAEWAFLSWDPTGDFSVRVGRLLFPTWLAGEYLNVGYLTPTRVLPQAVYSLAPFTAFDGISFTKSFSIGGPRLITQVYGGTPALVYPSVSLSNMYGLSATVEGDGWSVKAAYAAIMADLNTGAANKIGTFSRLSSLGYKVDMAGFVSWAEGFYGSSTDNSDLASATTRFAEEEGGGYVLVGYRIGKLLPRYTYTESHTRYGFLPEAKYKSHTVGLNYEINNQAAFKVEYEMIEVPVNYAPVAGTAPEGTAANPLVPKVVTDSSKTKGNAIYAGFDFTF